MEKSELVQITRQRKIAEEDFGAMINAIYEQIWQNLLPPQILTDDLTSVRANNVVTPPDAPVPDLPVPDVPVPDRGEPRRVAGWPVAPDGTVVRIVLTDRPGEQRMVSITADGEVVSAADMSVFMSRRDLTSWRLTRTQLATALGALDAAGVRTAEPGSFGEGNCAK